MLFVLSTLGISKLWMPNKPRPCKNFQKIEVPFDFFRYTRLTIPIRWAGYQESENGIIYRPRPCKNFEKIEVPFDFFRYTRPTIPIRWAGYQESENKAALPPLYFYYRYIFPKEEPKLSKNFKLMTPEGVIEDIPDGILAMIRRKLPV
ncbi:hypothetical protein TVAG_368260 [Trichomonas vaginalis G3]|uniref:Uncharacterized protein n=1 Tax=Trichomonas vaginalis (strain ATCC PRA-98 / G3) TaxID=412133 RepID=A2FI38_TRIV3|nr:hypothetical protein TVAG_368260 [Trichomonas vaginalis G3]|eukprot:XP_001308355.1 hypothetical protein [Trichomonas vaginalis G3]